jgi:hypothetical protein
MKLIAAAGIVAAGIVVATAMHIYFSPYQTCVRHAKVEGVDNRIWCVQIMGSERPGAC